MHHLQGLDPMLYLHLQHGHQCLVQVSQSGFHGAVQFHRYKKPKEQELSLMDTGGMAVAQVLSSSEADRAPSSKGQEKKDTENWGKLIFQLKQKHPEQGGELGIDQGAFSRQEFNSGLSHQDASGGVPLQKVNRDFNQDGKAPASFTA